ncbi:UNVERIFIED_CONTAM: Upstream activation factor subunit UAF30 [Sesamum radiatum]|uniref:Upstream activation factor subunit UAF30 n=1 Tax=Sesamum radiatum TaxID=300843 RepID=A0AAW2VJD7_SESRA
MSTPSGFFRASRAVLAAARSATPLTKPDISPSSTKKPTVAAAASAASKSPKVPKEKKVSTSGIMKPTPVSLALQSVVGAPEVSRVEAVKKIWAYIKLHNLQNPSNKKEIICDAKLKKLFNGKDKVGFLEIAKLLSPHFVKAN